MWEVVLRGDAHALKLLGESFTDGGVRVVERSGEWYLTSTQFDDLVDHSEVRARARVLADDLSGAARLILGWPAKITLGAILETRPDGTTNTILAVDSARHEMRVLPVTLTVTDPDGSRHVHHPGDPAVSWIRLAQEHEAVRRALRLFSKTDMTWVDLYRLMEVIEADAGEDLNRWLSKRQHRLFKHTANSSGAVGDAARHGAEATDPPDKPMSIGVARSLVKGVMRKWLDAKLAS